MEVLENETIIKKKHIILFVSYFCIVVALLCFIYFIMQDYPPNKVNYEQYWIDNKALLKATNVRQIAPIWSEYVFVIGFITSIILAMICFYNVRKMEKERIEHVSRIAFLISILNLFIFVSGVMGAYCYENTDEYKESDYDKEFCSKYFEFTHDDRKIVIRESSNLKSGWGDIYLVEEDGKMTQIGYYGTNEYSYNGNYIINWKEDGVDIEAVGDYMMPDDKLKISCKYIEDN